MYCRWKDKDTEPQARMSTSVKDAKQRGGGGSQALPEVSVES